MRSLFLSAAILAGLACAWSGDASAQVDMATRNALQDIARPQRDRAELLRRQDLRDSERAWREENAYVNAKRDARSMRRFDR